ncbi:MAG: peptidoglycan bridge formation glycyltransferase FemA/FemB family protein [Candidatus Colwellbacteria bacterium]|nr:peptidoglycan bridge formation glycyltransferase FemA/FemB family protein [Candidatus Colwellbacteria bacterium]
MFKIKEIKDKKVWESFVLSQRNKTFLHSWNWGKFNESLGSKVFRLGIYDSDGELSGVFLTLKIVARRGSFLFVPQGPVDSDTNFEMLEVTRDYLKNLALKENCSFVRISPILPNDVESENLFKKAGFRKAPMHMHAELMRVLDLSQSEEKILGGMRKTTRYSIKKAEREGVKIIKSRNQKDVAILKEVYDKTAKRQKFVAFSDDYLQNEFNSFKGDDQVLIFLGEYKNRIIAAAMIIFYGDAAFYHQGATSLEHPEIPAAYLLQWEAIKEAKRRGCKVYNFWGISADDKPNHPWAGLTLFKKGFGGTSEEYLGAQDLVVKPSYWLSFMIEIFRKARRRL